MRAAANGCAVVTSQTKKWSREELVALLDWYRAVGVDAVVAETPIGRPEAAGEAEPPAAGGPHGAPQPGVGALATPTFVAAPPDQTERLAQTVAAACGTLEELRVALEAFDGCNLRFTATNLVFADGTPGTRVMFVGEAPGRDEDLKGLPFVGRAGQLLDQMLKAIGLDRTTVYIANVVPWRPPGNRTPTPQETAACRPFIARQIELADPDFLVCLGNAAMRELLGTADGILKSRGRWRPYHTGRRTIQAMAMLHPAYLLRQPLHKRLAWRDLQSLKAALDGR